MFISDKIIFVELHKTASSHIRRILLELFEGESVGKHNQLTTELIDQRKTILGSVRNPYDWYVSLWGYGCDQMGGVFKAVTHRDRGNFRRRGWKSNPRGAALMFIEDIRGGSRRKEWEGTYKDASDPGGFRMWLKLISDPKYMADVGEGYFEWPGCGFVGLMTFRYLKLFCSTVDTNDKFASLRTDRQIKEFEEHNLLVDHFIRQESIEIDLVDIITKLKLKDPQGIEEKLYSMSRRNTSSRGRDLAYYYDQECLEIVESRERLVLDKFDYRF